MLLPPLSHRLNVMCIYTRTHTPAQAAASPSFYSATRVESLSSVQSGRKIDFAVHPPKKIEEFVVEERGDFGHVNRRWLAARFQCRGNFREPSLFHRLLKNEKDFFFYRMVASVCTVANVGSCINHNNNNKKEKDIDWRCWRASSCIRSPLNMLRPA